jgi:ERCC4-related helicase
MRYLKRYENHEDIASICRKYDIENYKINDDGSIDVDDYVTEPQTLHITTDIFDRL